MHILPPTRVCNRPLVRWGGPMCCTAQQLSQPFGYFFLSFFIARLGVGRSSELRRFPVLWPETTLPTLCRTFCVPMVDTRTCIHTLMPPSTPKCSLFFVLHYRIWFNLDNISFIYVACGHKFFLITSEPAQKHNDTGSFLQLSLEFSRINACC